MYMASLIRRRDRESAPLARSWDPLRTLDPFQMMRDVFRGDPFQALSPLLAPTELVFAPDIDIRETADGYVVRADLPGVREEDVDISAMGSTLTIRGKREQEERREDEQYYAYERSYGSFTRSFTMPPGANLDAATADLKDGVLTVSIPKQPEMRGKRISLRETKTLEQGKGKEEKEKEKKAA
jgi:HSP20 family protein